LEGFRRGMVRALGQFCRTMVRHHPSTYSRLPANRDDFGDSARLWAVDALSQRLLPGTLGC